MKYLIKFQLKDSEKHLLRRTQVFLTLSEAIEFARTLRNNAAIVGKPELEERTWE